MGYVRTQAGSRRRALRGCFGAFGDDAVPTSAVAVLAAQVNRFGPDAPAAYRYAPSPFPVGDVLAPDLALTALTIYLRRSTDAYQSSPDAGTRQAIDQANAGFANPVAFVNGHLVQVTQVLRGFADALGLPPAPGAEAEVSGAGVLLLVLAGLGAWWWLEQRDMRGAR